MKYYKISCGADAIGVCSTNDFRKYQPKHSILVLCDETEVQFAAFDGVLYKDRWMKPCEQSFDYTEASVVEIEEPEYLSSATGNDPADIEDDTVFSPKNAQNDDILAGVRSAKIVEMTQRCRQKIEEGVTLELYTGWKQHFGYSFTDQLNLISSMCYVNAGNPYAVYRAEGEQNRFYSAEDLMKIYQAQTDNRVYHLEYLASMKMYINSIEDERELSELFYGEIIPIDFQTDLLKRLISLQQNE